jgi:hypothetical protein
MMHVKIQNQTTRKLLLQGTKQYEKHEEEFIFEIKNIQPNHGHIQSFNTYTYMLSDLTFSSKKSIATATTNFTYIHNSISNGTLQSDTPTENKINYLYQKFFIGQQRSKCMSFSSCTLSL